MDMSGLQCTQYPYVFPSCSVSILLTVSQTFIHLCSEYGFPFNLFQRHLGFMLEESFTRSERGYFNSLTSFAGVVDHLVERGVDMGNVVDGLIV